MSPNGLSAVRRNDFYFVSDPDLAFSQNPRVHPTPPWMQFLRDADEMPLEKRLADGLARLGEGRNLQDNISPHSELCPGDNQVPIEATDGEVLAGRTDIDRVPLCPQRLNPFQ